MKLLVKSLLIAGTLCGLSSLSHAYDESNFITCTTVSNGLNFSKSELHADLARQLVRDACEQSSSTNNSECDANVTCDSNVPAHFVTCSTESNGLNFQKSELNPGLARQLAIQDCEQSSSTNNAECDANITCDDQTSLRFVSCSTMSNGLNFEKSERSMGLARQLAVQSCEQNSSTNNAECDANSICAGEVKPLVKCSTESNGLVFEKVERSYSVARDQSLKACEQSSSTNNSECDGNVICRSMKQ